MKKELQHIYDTTKAHIKGERFSGWRAEYNIEDFKWAADSLDELAKSLNLKPYDDRSSKWLSVLKGIGAHVEEHTEGYNEGDKTIILFLNFLEEGDGGELVVMGKEHRPEEGKYVVFPSNVPHSVNPLKVDKPRITIGGIFHP